jgi:hypothetical protein
VVKEEDEVLLPSKATPEQSVSIQDFQSIVGSLLWIARCTRPDILFAVHAATRRSHAPRLHDLKICRKILRYLKGTKNFKLKFNKFKGEMVVEAFSDADWADNKCDRKSVSGGIVYFCGVPVSWICKKQPCVSLSTQEAEFIAGSEVIREVIGVQELMDELNIQVLKPSKLYMDNKEGIRQVMQESSSAKLKHVDMRYKFVCDRASKGQIQVDYVKSEDQVADIFTKPLPLVKLSKFRSLCGLSE